MLLNRISLSVPPWTRVAHVPISRVVGPSLPLIQERWDCNCGNQVLRGSVLEQDTSRRLVQDLTDSKFVLIHKQYCQDWNVEMEVDVIL
jgi:hypothetical protein